MRWIGKNCFAGNDSPLDPEMQKTTKNGALQQFLQKNSLIKQDVILK